MVVFTAMTPGAEMGAVVRALQLHIHTSGSGTFMWIPQSLKPPWRTKRERNDRAPGAHIHRFFK